MSEIITIYFEPIQILMDYIFANYRDLKNHCHINNEDVSVKDCVVCH